MAAASSACLSPWWGSDALVGLKPDGVPRLGEVRVDRRSSRFGVGIALVTGLLVGSIPALQITRGALWRVEGGRTRRADGTPSPRVRRGLVVAELALAVALLAGAGLLVNSFIRVQRVDPGFQTGRR